MKKFFLLISMMCSLMMMAQVPQGINYQAAVRDANGIVAANANATFQISFIDKADNSVDYVESFNTTTDQFGLVNFVLGQGLPNGAAFSTLDWTKQFKLKVEVNMGQGLILLGTQDLVSVPYALESGHADMSLTELNDVDVTGAVSGEVLMFDGTTWIPSIVSGAFGLPYNVSDPNLVSFAITNTSALGGNAIYGKTTTNSVTANGIRGESTGASGNGVHGTATGANAFGVLGENTQGTGIKGTSNNANGVHGIGNSTNAVGVRGESEGTGVIAYSGSGNGLIASSLSGTAVTASSTSGYALNTSGNVKIAGGNTTPGAGKVLTSDATGNATWQAPPAVAPKIAFRSAGADILVPPSINHEMEFSSEAYDFGNAFNPTASGGSVFTAPLAGVYHFDGAVNLLITSQTICFETDFSNILLQVTYPDNSTTTMASQDASFSNSLAFCGFTADVSADFFLPAGAKVHLIVFQENDDDLGIMPSGSGSTFFSGHLVMAQ